MRATAWLRRNRADVAGAVLAAFAVAAILAGDPWEAALGIPLILAMFLGMLWHGRRRQVALAAAEGVAEVRASLLSRQARFLHDASHELRTPVTIARGHLELLRWDQQDSPELEVALDELGRIERIVNRLLLLAKAEQPGFVVHTDVDLELFLSDVFMRWSEVAPRAWRLDLDLVGTVRADPEALRDALDALLENAVKYTDAGETIVLRAYAEAGGVAIEVADEGRGLPEEALPRIFDRWARADGARTREQGGAGLGLAIVAAIAHAHGGSCTVAPQPRGTAFTLHVPVEAGDPRTAPALDEETRAAVGLVAGG
jgi:signal transduction histidine kinase